jgi:hypothetical protein
MYETGEINNIIHAGLVFILYLFVVIVLYYAISYPIELIFNSLVTSSQNTASGPYMTSFMPSIKWGLNVAFALGIAFPVVWFIMWIFSQEPDFSMFKR